MASTLQQFVEGLLQSGLLTAAEWTAVQGALDRLPPHERPRDVQALARYLIQTGKLTRYQANAIYQGKTKGLVFGEYRVLDKIGQGGMGVVLKAEHRRLGRVVAIKVLPSAALKSPETVQRFYREVAAAGRLDHPNIVLAYDAGEAEGVHYLAMEYVDGQDLAKLVADRGPLPVHQAVQYVLQAARGLHYAHQQGIVHRDIKPSNLLLDKKGTVKILDMGLARMSGAAAMLAGAGDRLTLSGQVMGTCDYMAPEQAEDTHGADHRADIYSLGCTLYRLLTGEAPYTGDSLVQVLLAHREAPIPSLCDRRPDVPATLDAICRKMLAKRPADRHQSMQEVIADLEAFLRGAPPPPPIPDDVASSSEDGELRAALSFLEEPAPAPARVVTRHRTAPIAQETVARRMGDEPTGRSVTTRVKQLAAAARRKPLVGFAAVGIGAVLVVVVAALFVKRPLPPEERVASTQLDGALPPSEAGGLAPPSGSAGGVESATPGAPQSRAVSAPSPGKAPGSAVGPTAGAIGHPSPGKAGGSPEGPPPLAIAPFDAATARKHQEAWAKYLGVPVEFTNAIGMKFVLIPPGEFEMGASQAEIDQALGELKALEKHMDRNFFDLNTRWIRSEGPRHRVRITRPFYLGKHEVTVGQFRQFAQECQYRTDAETRGGSFGLDVATGQWRRFADRNWRNPGSPQDDTHPVLHISWNDAFSFCLWLTDAEAQYRLPTEAEWEWACRAGTTTAYFTGSDASSLKGFANMADASLPPLLPRDVRKSPVASWEDGHPFSAPVGRFQPNPFGLHDMIGNAVEWCADWYAEDYYAHSPTDDPAGPASRNDHVLRGASWHHFDFTARCTSRIAWRPGDRDQNMGFRVVLEIPLPAMSEPAKEPSPPNTLPQDERQAAVAPQ